jgi:glycosyltransferase involved in cell wall biosynthesis
VSLVSLIMPAWNPNADWLRDAVKSALDEQECDVELIVVDDGNEQPVSKLLTSIHDPRIRVIRVEHCGPYEARNAGLRESTGNYVRYVDADDIVEAGSTGRLLALARDSSEETVAYGWTMVCDDQLEQQSLVAETIEGHVAEECLLGDFDVYHVSMLLPRAVVERAGPWEAMGFRVSGDSDYVQRVVEQAPVRGLGEVVTLYRRHPSSVSKQARVADAVNSGVLILDRYFARHPEQRGTALERHAYTILHLRRARSHLGKGEVGSSLRQLALATRRDPLLVTTAGFRLAAKQFAQFAGPSS